MIITKSVTVRFTFTTPPTAASTDAAPVGDLLTTMLYHDCSTTASQWRRAYDRVQQTVRDLDDELKHANE